VNKPRKAWIAAILSLLTLGLGHLYSGEVKKGLFIYFVFQFPIGFLLAIILAISPDSLGFVLIIFVPICLYIYWISDSVRLSKTRKANYQLKKYNRWYVYLLCISLSWFLFHPLYKTVVNIFVMQAYKIPSGAMAPTLEIGDYILARKGLFLENIVKRGDIVIFSFPGDKSKDFIKRVIGLGGEQIEINEKRIIIDGLPLKESYTIFKDNRIFPGHQAPRDNFGPLKIPDESLFLMGDNRDQSNDSRYWGVVRKKSIKGRAVSIYWSWDSINTNVRWQRIGSKIK
jgi:signal peptidase I